MKTHLTLLLLWPVLLFGQSTPLGVQLSPDCPFADYLQTEVAWPNYTADPPDVVVTADASNLYFVGNQNFNPRFDTVAVARFGTPDDPAAWLKAYRRGLLPYLLQSGQAADFEYALPNAPTAWDLVHDPWGQWVFRLSGDGTWGRQRFSDQQPNGNTVGRTRLKTDQRLAFEVWRITPRHRFSTNLSGSFVQQRQVSSNLPATAFEPDRDDHNFTLNWSAEWVRSLGQHWSLGVRGNANTFNGRYTVLFPGLPIGFSNNHGASVDLGLGAEWSLWPYRDFFRRRLLVNYLLKVGRNDYLFYDRLPFGLNNVLQLSTVHIREWGFWSAQVAAAVPIPDEKNTFSLDGGANATLGWNVGQRLLVRVSGDLTVSRRSRQFTGYFPDGSIQEVYYRYHVVDCRPEVGLAYFFGQRSPNVVNPRLTDFRTPNF